MKTVKKQFQTIDEYISSFPENIQDILQELRKAILSLAPDATETISYQMPTFKLKGILVHFAAYKTHIGFYPTPSGINTFREELARYEIRKGTIKFPISEPIPFHLVKKIVKYRVQENLAKK